MNQFRSFVRFPIALVTLLLAVFTAGCGSGGLDPILGTPAVGGPPADVTRPTVLITVPAGQTTKLQAQFTIRIPADRMLVGGNRRS